MMAQKSVSSVNRYLQNGDRIDSVPDEYACIFAMEFDSYWMITKI